MGIFFDHGLAYLVRTDAVQNITLSVRGSPKIFTSRDIGGELYFAVIDTKETDSRLLKTSFYRQHEDSWLDVHSSFARTLPRPPPDFIISEGEKETIQKFEEAVGSKGSWYEVNYMSFTY